ncbi:MAG: Flp pilus assembly complex ATPase component TadA [Candidatus Niyogibacteria bacterium]|nr:MAG: Flp pilus assembly complex ATPase component TadA [Candidatus Niyogibacteria bacterium]
MKIDPERLKLFILDSELISKDDFERAQKKATDSGKDIADVLVESGKISDDDLRRLHAYILGVPFVNLEQEKIDPRVLGIIPEPIARSHNIVAYRLEGGNLEVAMLDPQDLAAIDFIKKKANLKIKPRLTSQSSMTNVLRQYQKSLAAEFGEIIKKEAGEIKQVLEVGVKDASGEDLKKAAEELPIIRIVDTLLRHAIVQHASDIHIEPLEKELLMRYRIDGILRDAMVLPKQVATGIIARVKVLANLKLDEHRLPQDGRFMIETDEEKVSFRVSVLPVFDGEKAVLRLLPENKHGFTLEQLGFRGEGLERIERAIRKPTGMILATGPTGSGKTTTLYTVLEILNTPAVNISTVEDPIEYRIPRINQSQVRPDIGFSFANGLRSLLRQDPDILMVGEIRDNETASLAVNASLTGHLVLSTLHTNSAAGALPRLLEMKVEPFLISSTVNVIIAQRLVRRLCERNKSYNITESEVRSFGQGVDPDKLIELLRKEKIIKPKDGWKDIKFYRPAPTADCPDGYKDRIGIHEVLEMSETIKEMTVRQATSDEIAKQARLEGMVTMFEDGIIKAAQGITSLEEIMRVTSE